MRALPGGQACLFEIVDQHGRALAHVALETPELDQLVGRLAELRTGLGEPVPMATDPGARLSVQVDPAVTVRRLVGSGAQSGMASGAVLALRHSGLGWLGFLLPPTKAGTLSQALARLAVVTDEGEAGLQPVVVSSPEETVTPARAGAEAQASAEAQAGAGRNAVMGLTAAR